MNTTKTRSRTFVFFVAILSWTMSVEVSQAFFRDVEASKGNSIGAGAGSLDLVLDTNVSGYNGPIIIPDALPGNKFKTSITVRNAGTMNFQYLSQFQKTSGDDLLCETLRLKVKAGNQTVFNGNLSDFSYQKNLLSPIDSDDWEFSINVPESLNKKFEGLSCGFNFVFVAWQTNHSTPSTGWVDQEIMSENIVTMGHWEESVSLPEKGVVVMNEISPNPEGRDDAKMPGGEWIEIFNNSEEDVDVSGCYFKDRDNNKLLISSKNSDNDGDTSDEGETIVPAQSYLVVYDNSAFSLNNAGGDTVSFFNSADEPMDDYSYDDGYSNQPGDTFARFPDGTGPWFDPKPTPGKRNRLTGTYLENAQEIVLEDCFENNKLTQNEEQPLCSPVFVEHIHLIKSKNSKKLSEKFRKETETPKEETSDKNPKKSEPDPIETPKKDIAIDDSPENTNVETKTEPKKEDVLPTKENEDVAIQDSEETQINTPQDNAPEETNKNPEENSQEKEPEKTEIAQPKENDDLEQKETNKNKDSDDEKDEEELKKQKPEEEIKSENQKTKDDSIKKETEEIIEE